MHDADPNAAGDADDPGVLGSLPASRPQHRSARRANAASRRSDASARSAAGRPDGRPRSSTESPAPSAIPAAPAAPRSRSPKPPPDVPAPPPAPRSGWATPPADDTPKTQVPPLVALADGTVRAGARLVRGVLRRLPGV